MIKVNTRAILAGGLSLALVATACNNDDEPLIPASEGAVLDIEVGGETQPNQVFVDLSTDQQTVVNRGTWDVAFYSGTEFVVMLNSSASAMARSTGKTEIADVTAADIDGFEDQLDIDAIFGTLFAPPPYPPWLNESATWIDDPEGDLTETAIESISVSETANEVYYVSRGTDPNGVKRGAFLIKVTHDGTAYTLEYQEVGGTQALTQTVDKDPAFNSVFFNFDTGVINVEPAKDQWDIAFTVFVGKLDVGGGLLIPYSLNDVVIQNRFETQVAVVEIGLDDVLLDEFDSFAMGDVSGLTFSTVQNFIGTDWRTVASPTPGSVTGVREDRFYVIQDAGGNTYKLLFTQMLSESGERGFPEILYEIVN